MCRDLIEVFVTNDDGIRQKGFETRKVFFYKGQPEVIVRIHSTTLERRNTWSGGREGKRALHRYTQD